MSVNKVSGKTTASEGVAISELQKAGELTGNELFPVVQDEETRSATINQIAALIPAGDAGASAYDIWATAQPEGADTSEAAYQEYMRGSSSGGLSAMNATSIEQATIDEFTAAWAAAAESPAPAEPYSVYYQNVAGDALNAPSSYVIIPAGGGFYLYVSGVYKANDVEQFTTLVAYVDSDGDIEIIKQDFPSMFSALPRPVIVSYEETQTLDTVMNNTVEMLLNTKVSSDISSLLYNFKLVSYDDTEETGSIRIIQQSAQSGWYVHLYGEFVNPGTQSTRIIYISDDKTQTVICDYSVPGAIPISEESNNALTMKPDGLFAKDTQTAFTRVASTGAWAANYADNKSAANACGPMGKGCYFKRTMAVSAGTGNYNVIAQAFPMSLPCLEDGTPVPFQCWAGHVESSGFAVWLICSEIPTHTLSLSTGAIAAINRYDDASGLPDYPVIETGDELNSVEFRTLYYYGKTV